MMPNENMLSRPGDPRANSPAYRLLMQWSRHPAERPVPYQPYLLREYIYNPSPQLEDYLMNRMEDVARRVPMQLPVPYWPDRGQIGPFVNQADLPAPQVRPSPPQPSGQPPIQRPQPNNVTQPSWRESIEDEMSEEEVDR